jgi:CheY-like chemotaxis protein
VLDLHMPGRSGLEVLPEIKRLPSPPCVVVLTSHPTEQHRRLSLASGADFFFDKAQEFALVVELVRTRL